MGTKWAVDARRQKMPMVARWRLPLAMIDRGRLGSVIEVIADEAWPLIGWKIVGKQQKCH